MLDHVTISLALHCYNNPHLFIWQWYVYQLIQTSRSEDGRVNNVGTIGGSNDEDILLGAHPVHFGEDLVDNSIGSTTYMYMYTCMM
jgi:hypothetical protein